MMEEDRPKIYPMQFLGGLFMMFIFACLVQIGLTHAGVCDTYSFEIATGIWLISIGYNGLK